MKFDVIVVGAGVSGLSAASVLSKLGKKVLVLEKHQIPGGRARKFEHEGFTFDIGPTWYWIPDVFEQYFSFFGKSISSYYHLHRLDPSYRIFYPEGKYLDLSADFEQLKSNFESIEKGAAKKLELFLADAKEKYRIGMQKFVYKPSLSIFEYAEIDLFKSMFKLSLFESVSSQVKKHFKNSMLIQALEFPVIFLGAPARDIPALYTLMNYADIVHGTWFPKGGMYSVVQAMFQLAQEQGVEFQFNQEVKQLVVENNKIVRVVTDSESYEAAEILSTADYHHTETVLLSEGLQSYTKNYWNNRKMAPSAMLIYMGLNKKLEGALHHNLIFDCAYERHLDQIFKTPAWPDDPAVYLSCATKTDSALAPENHENVIVLVPLAPGLSDNPEKREELKQIVVEKIEKNIKQKFQANVLFTKTYAMDNFSSDYHAYKGNAYGLSNTIDQTAVLKPRMRSKKVGNLWYAGQLTVPGPGVPPCIISGMIAAKEINKVL